MQSRKDAALRKIVEDGKLPIKTRREALAAMDAPSRAFLTTLSNDTAAPAKLRLDASRRLPETERRISENREAQKRLREIDRILAECALEQDAKSEGPKPITESPSPAIMEPQTTAAAVPREGPSSVAAPEVTSQPGETVETCESNESGKRTDDRQSKCAELVERGRNLATAILAQYERFTRAPFNQQEGKKLDNLQAAFLTWERQTHIQFPEIDTAKEFPDPRLRPAPPRILDERAYQRHRRMLEIDEQCGIPMKQARPTHGDNGMWGGLPPGI
jgi:hypothetical protein